MGLEMTTKYPWYTGAGDDGTTGLLGEGRVPKYHPQPAAFGTVDEVSSSLGYARALIEDNDSKEMLLRVQRDCYQMMAELASTSEAQPQFRMIGVEQVGWLEEQTDLLGAKVELPREFIVPGDSVEGAALDVARTIARRAERQVVKLLDDGLIENQSLIAYLNRLSSLLFVLARYQDAMTGKSIVTLAKTSTPA